MRILATVFCMLLVAAALSQASAGDADMAKDVNAAAAALDKAFAQGDAAAIKTLMTPDHVSVTPYYDGPQSTDQQIASLPELKFNETIMGAVKVTMLAPDAAMRSFTAKLEGSFKGKPLPSSAYATEILVKRDGVWMERFYQVTALSP